MLRVIAADGALVDPSGPQPDLALGVRLLADLERARAFDRLLLRQARRGRVKGYYPSAGQEALAAVAPAVGAEDMVFPAYREQPLRLAMGVTVAEEVAMWAGAPRAAWDPMARRMMPANTAIGSHLPHAVGWAMAQQRLGTKAVAWAVFGDGATSEGDFHAAANLAGVQSAPIVLVCQNNQYAQTTPVSRQTGSATIADKAAAYGIVGERVDGMDPFAVHEAAQRAARRAREGGGSTLIELVMYRFSGHSSFEVAPGYRARSEEAHWKTLDPLVRLHRHLASRGVDVERTATTATAGLSQEVEHAVESVAAMTLPTPEELKHWLGVADAPTEPSAAATLEDGLQGPEPATIAQALNLALHQQMAEDPYVVVFGQDIADGGVWTVTTGLRDAFGDERVIDAPLNEVAIVGAAIGMALAGLRPVVEIQFGGFVLTALDQLLFHAARYSWRTQGAVRVPLVVRMPAGGGHGGYEGHSDSFDGVLAQVPGLVVVAPSNPRDAHGLLAAAVRADAPVVVLEPTAQYVSPCADVDADGEPLGTTGHAVLPIGHARHLTRGDAVTLITYGSAVPVVRRALAMGAPEDVDGVDVLDLRSLSPWDVEAVSASVERTGRCVVVHDSPRTAGVGAEVAATVSERCHDHLQHPVVRVAQPDLPYGPALMEPTTALTPEAVLTALERVRQDTRSRMTDIP